MILCLFLAETHSHTALSLLKNFETDCWISSSRIASWNLLCTCIYCWTNYSVLPPSCCEPWLWQHSAKVKWVCGSQLMSSKTPLVSPVERHQSWWWGHSWVASTRTQLKAADNTAMWSWRFRVACPGTRTGMAGRKLTWLVSCSCMSPLASYNNVIGATDSCSCTNEY
jgi:hypothetical protein